MDILLQDCLEYATCKFYRITTTWLSNVYGILLHYSSSDVTLLTEKGLVKMPQSEILTMRPSNGSDLSVQDKDYIKLLEKCGIQKIAEEYPEDAG